MIQFTNGTFYMIWISRMKLMGKVGTFQTPMNHTVQEINYWAYPAVKYIITTSVVVMDNRKCSVYSYQSLNQFQLSNVYPVDIFFYMIYHFTLYAGIIQWYFKWIFPKTKVQNVKTKVKTLLLAPHLNVSYHIECAKAEK